MKTLRIFLRILSIIITVGLPILIFMTDLELGKILLVAYPILYSVIMLLIKYLTYKINGNSEIIKDPSSTFPLILFSVVLFVIALFFRIYIGGMFSITILILTTALLIDVGFDVFKYYKNKTQNKT